MDKPYIYNIYIYIERERDSSLRGASIDAMGPRDSGLPTGDSQIHGVLEVRAWF